VPLTLLIIDKLVSPIRSGIRLIFDPVRSGPVSLLKLAGTGSQVNGDSEFRFFAPEKQRVEAEKVVSRGCKKVCRFHTIL
jgi:hypothetical protein